MQQSPKFATKKPLLPTPCLHRTPGRASAAPLVTDAGRCGERPERCRWQRKRGERVAAVKILSDSRKAAQKFWAPQQGHRPLRSSIGEWRCRGRPPRRPAQPCTAPLAKTCHCETSAHTGCGNPYCLKKAQRARSNPARCAELFIVKGNPVTSRCGCSAFPDSGKCWPPSCAAPWPRSSRSPSVKTRPCGPKSP